MEFKIEQIIELETKKDRSLKALVGARAIIYSLKSMPEFVHLVWLNKKAVGQEIGGYYPTGFKIVRYGSQEELKYLYDQKLIDNLTYIENLAILKSYGT